MTDALDAAVPDVWVDVHGATLSHPALDAVVDGVRFRFVGDPALKAGRRFHLGAFFSKAVRSPEAFRYPRARRVAVLAESPIDASYRDIPGVLHRFPMVFTHQRELLDRGAPFHPLMFGTNWLGVGDEVATSECLAGVPEKSRMVSFIGSLQHPDTGAYRFRREIAEFAVGRGDVDCFGRGIREIAGKREALAPYRFSIAMENAAADDYFSEKLVDCLLLGTVPIYYGWPRIAECLDPRGLLLFHDRDSLAAILDRLSPALYEQMRPYVLDNRQRLVAERWHNHAGLVARIAERLPRDLGNGAAANAHRLSAALRRVASRWGLRT